MRAHDSENDRSDRRAAVGRSSGRGGSGPGAGLRALQRAVGNAAVARAVARERGGQGAYGIGVHRGAGGPAVQRAGDADLRSAKNPQEIVAALEKSGHSQDDAWELMRHMTSQQFEAREGQSEFNILDSIKDASKVKISPVRERVSAGLLGKRWTIRHYTGKDPKAPPGFGEIASTYDNAAAGRANEHTNVADWRALGNIKFTFYLVAVDGKVPPRNWLNNTHWYAEWDLDSIGDCWASPDLLETMNKSMDADEARAAMKGVKAFRGSGRELKRLLATSVMGNDPAAALDAAIGGAFELKVPGGLALPDTGWQKK